VRGPGFRNHGRYPPPKKSGGFLKKTARRPIAKNSPKLNPMLVSCSSNEIFYKLLQLVFEASKPMNMQIYGYSILRRGSKNAAESNNGFKLSL